MKDIKNIIFDLGGVIIDLDQHKTIREFNKLSGIPMNHLEALISENKIFNALDKGTITEESFFAELKKEIRFDGADELLLHAWNAMLLDVPEERLDMLVTMKQNYNTFLLSNTCEPHITAFEHDLYIKHGVKNFNDYFDEVYYSCRVGMRKPDSAIFEFVLKQNDLIAEETVFIDDTAQHVKGAGACGIKSYLLPKGVEINDFLTELGLLE